MDFLELAVSRKSIRDFKQDDVSDELVTRLLKAAQAAPSAGNRQPWHFFVIRDNAVKQTIADKSYRQSFIASAPVLFVVCADIIRSEERYENRGRHLYCIQDTAAAVQNILLCAHESGLGACWCGAFDEFELSGILDLRKDMRPVAVIPVGYPNKEPLKRDRRPIEEIATFIHGEK